MKVRDYLSVSYKVEAQPIENNGEWTRRLRYPELDGCEAEGEDVESTFQELERRRIAEIIRRLRAGELPPVPRPPLATANPGWTARSLGVWHLVEGVLDCEPEDLQAGCRPASPLAVDHAGGGHNERTNNADG